MQQEKTAESQWWGTVRLLSAEEELQVTDDIAAGRDFIHRSNTDLTKDEIHKKAVALAATHRLVEAYAVLIEKIAREQYASVENPTVEYNDFVAEAYIVAFQCAKNFNPQKSKNPIRFSSYVSRAISSALTRVSMRSRTSLYVPTNTMSQARKWGHTYFEMLNKGIQISDEDVSAISGVQLTQQDARMILETAASSSIDDLEYTSVLDHIDFNRNTNDVHQELQHTFTNNSEYFTALTEAISQVFGDGSEKILAMLGLQDGYALFSGFLLASYSGESSKKMDEFLQINRSLLNHPIVRMSLCADLEKNLRR